MPRGTEIKVGRRTYELHIWHELPATPEGGLWCISPH